MTRIAFVFVFLLTFAPQRVTAQTTPDPERMTAALELLEATGATKSMDAMIDAMLSGFRTGAQGAGASQADPTVKAFESYMTRFASYKQEMLNDIAGLYAREFTAEELRAVTTFYRSGPGAKFVEKMPQLMQSGAQIGMRYSQKMVEDLRSGVAPKP